MSRLIRPIIAIVGSVLSRLPTTLTVLYHMIVVAAAHWADVVYLDELTMITGLWKLGL